MKTLTVYMREGNMDKVYVATLDGQFVNCAWGRRGGTMQTKTYGPFAEAKAEEFYVAKLADKTSKGYRPGPDAAPIVDPAFVQGAQSIASGASQMDLANADYRPMLLNEVTDKELLEKVYDARYVVQSNAAVIELSAPCAQLRQQRYRAKKRGK